ncbi:MAG: ATP-binding protein [Bifidobacteriaceae bacterium]|nr:ATP-binding protein [Bifidobacteriaceae bacterium]
MDEANNPYSPGAGRLPVALVGRDAQLKAWDTRLRRVEAGRDSQPLALYGLRGVGKTVLLAQFARQARERGWLVARVEAKADASIRQLIGEELAPGLADLARPGMGSRVLKALKTALSFKASYDTSGTWSFGVDLSGVTGSNANTGSLEADLGKLLRDLAGAAAEDGKGVALLVDEIQDLEANEIVALSAIAHRAAQDRERLAMAVAGLPSLPRVLTDAKSYAERLFEYHSIGPLEPTDAKRALIEPAQAEDVAWANAAARLVLDAANGYPYFLQQFGQDSWNAASDSPITVADAKVGLARGWHSLDLGFFRARWERATEAEKTYLTAMAPDGDRGTSTATVGQRLGRHPKSLSLTRANLIDKGLIYAPDHGMVAFTVPGMATFIHRWTAAQ